ncbi:transposable element Tcb2 transposase [Trichonephila clavipes]|nr:transposable element Tcb2 transposase [Trichonephila clavipes]
MAWGVFVWYCLGSLVRIPISLNAIRYVEFLGDPLHSFIMFCYPHSKGVFQQDHCASHKSKLAIGWLDEYYAGFSVINWLPRSSDLSSIKHLWDVLK